MVSKLKKSRELTKFFENPKNCADFLASMIWEDGKPKCPHCGSQNVYTTKSRSHRPEKRNLPDYRCAERECSKKFSMTTKTIFHSSRIPLRDWFSAIYLLALHKKGITSVQLAEELNITQRSAWHMLHRLRILLEQKAPHMLKGVVEVDETYVGGRNKNRHKHKKIKNSQGRSAKDKTPIVGLIERGGDLRTIVVAETDRGTLHGIVRSNVEVDTLLVTDDYKSYRGLNMIYDHKMVKHKEWYVSEDKALHTNNIEGHWGTFKKGMKGVYNSVKRKHLQKYSDEFTFRWNHRGVNAIRRFEIIVSKAANTRLPYDVLIGRANNPLYNKDLNAIPSKDAHNKYDYLDDLDFL